MKTYIVDSFTTEPFKGNPAGVCFPVQPVSEEKMLKIANELGLSETAFLHATDKEDTYTIRYFSPKKEIPLCGHATLAAAKVLFKENQQTELYFITGEQLNLFIKKHDEEIVMEFPVYHTIAASAPPAMLSALGLKRVSNTAFSEKNKIFILEIDDVVVLANLQPDYTALLDSYKNINGVLVTAPSCNGEYDFHYRYFWPWAGTNEDPVTGGVQTFLAKYWGDKLGKKSMKAFQSSARTGFMRLELLQETVLLISQAVIVFEGDLFI